MASDYQDKIRINLVGWSVVTISPFTKQNLQTNTSQKITTMNMKLIMIYKQTQFHQIIIIQTPKRVLLNLPGETRCKMIKDGNHDQN